MFVLSAVKISRPADKKVMNSKLKVCVHDRRVWSIKEKEKTNENLRFVPFNFLNYVFRLNLKVASNFKDITQA